MDIEEKKTDRKAYHKQYRATNKERDKYLRKAYYQRNKEIIKLRSKIWRENNKDYQKNRTKTYFQKYKNSILLERENNPYKRTKEKKELNYLFCRVCKRKIGMIRLSTAKIEFYCINCYIIQFKEDY